MNSKVSNLSQLVSVRRYILRDGKEAGLDVIDCDTGKIRFLVNVTKACDIMQLYHMGQNVSFISKNGFSNQNMPFLNRFEGGMLYTCGIDSIGDRDGFEPHGTLHNTPAKIISTRVDENGIVIEAEISVSSLYSENLVLRRIITANTGGESLRIDDVLCNNGYKDEKYCLLYHVNVGYPMLDDGAEIIADVAEFKPRTKYAEDRKSEMYKITDAYLDEEECCYFLNLNYPRIALVNRKIGKTLKLSYSGNTLQHFVEWKSMVKGDYALGLEPCTSELDGGFTYRAIRPSERIGFSINIEVKKAIRKQK